MFDRLKPSYLKQRRPMPVHVPAGHRYAGDDPLTGQHVFIPERCYEPDPDGPSSCSWCETSIEDCYCHEEIYLGELVD